MNISSDASARDLLRTRKFPILAYVLPIAAIIVAGFVRMNDAWRSGVWALACLVMGAACLVNALRCGRVHCFFTGPFLLAVAMAAILYGAGALPPWVGGWNLLGLVLLVGFAVLTYVPEMIFGTYRARRG